MYMDKKNEDGTTAVTPNLVVGVNDQTNRAALGGRYSSQFIERRYAKYYFQLRRAHFSD